MKKELKFKKAKKNGVHVRFDNFEKIDKIRCEHGYKSFSSFTRDAVNHFIGWLDNAANKK